MSYGTIEADDHSLKLFHDSIRSMSESQRLYQLDILRILAAFAIVVLHICSRNFSQISIEKSEWQQFAFINGLTRWAVPVFIMISGSLFLNPSKKIIPESVK